MINETTIRKIVDNILLNASSVNSSGLYNGKAGMALALFEAARYLKDDGIEEKAFNLFQESLIRTEKSNDLSFENGLSGIGHTLIYLITNQFLDADFDEIFKSQTEKIINDFKDIDKSPQRLLNLSTVIYFLSVLKNIHRENETIHQIIEKIFRGMELYLSLQFFDWKDLNYINKKKEVLQTFETYLKLVSFAKYTDFSNYLVGSYCDLYRENRIASSLSTGYYLRQIMQQSGITKYKDVIENHINYGSKNIHPELQSLEQSLETAKILDDQSVVEANPQLIKLMSGGENFGYRNGLSRYLIFLVNKKAVLL